ncbi:hypothetical protein Y032_0197g1560 [Ancylostoma ceylanicum]|uniref:DOMON domain-containing protein n=2 Tax=Ancylostoma ceylanicum TaxID=53326 RepID=A0A016SP65_9BILA|nr:hypothetical protein Y032_0197g1560 [Ancylostoma ceylanicum]
MLNPAGRRGRGGSWGAGAASTSALLHSSSVSESITAAMWLCLFAILPVLIDAKALATNEPKDPSCSFEAEGYSLSWTYDDPSSDVVFKMVARSELKNFWAGFFMGDEQPEDSIGAFVRNGQIGLMDGYVAGDRIVLDNTTNVQALLFDLQDDTLTAEFARPISSSDPSDADLTGCTTFFFPTGAVEMDSDGQIHMPKEMYRKRVCDIAMACSSRDRPSGLVKRSDASVCEHTQGKSTVRWKRIGDSVMFSIGQNAQPGKWWSAIGIGHGMQDLKMAIAFLDDGELKSVGGFQTQGYGVPRPDQSIKPTLIEKGTKVSNDRSYVQFSLPLETFHSKMDDSGCVTLQIAVLGGEWLGAYAIRKHEKTPEAVLVCGIDQCLDNIGVSSGAAPTTVAQPSPQPGQAATEKQESAPEGATTQKETNQPQIVTANEETLKSESATASKEVQPQIVTANEETLKSESASASKEVKGSGNGAAPVAARPANDVDSSGIEPANETSIFESAARAIDALPEGSGSEASAEGELPKAEESHDTEILTTAPNSVAEGGDVPAGEGQTTPKLTTVDGEARISTYSREFIRQQTTISNFPATTPLPSVAPALDGAPQTAVPALTGTSQTSAPPADVGTPQTVPAEGVPIPTKTPEDGLPSPTNATVAAGGEQTTPATVPTVSAGETVRKPLVLSKAVAPAVSNILINGCSDGHTDLRVCESYFADYLGKVKEWADRHNQILGQQMWKVCLKHICCFSNDIF